MEKEILLALRGLQIEVEENSDTLETITPAEYYMRNGNHYVVYDEVMEGFTDTTKNIFKFRKSCLEVTKKGTINVHMIFEEHKKNITSYHTPFGEILIGIDTESISITEEANRIQVHVVYALEANYQHVADCCIDMDIRPRSEGNKMFT